jgi:hypothetical protein
MKAALAEVSIALFRCAKVQVASSAAMLAMFSLQVATAILEQDLSKGFAVVLTVDLQDVSTRREHKLGSPENPGHMSADPSSGTRMQA